MGGPDLWGGGKSALTLEVKLEGALGGWIVWVCESALTLEVNLGGCVLGGWICWGKLVRGWIGTHFGSKVGGGHWGDQLGADWHLLCK